MARPGRYSRIESEAAPQQCLRLFTKKSEFLSAFSEPDSLLGRKDPLLQFPPLLPLLALHPKSEDLTFSPGAELTENNPLSLPLRS